MAKADNLLLLLLLLFFLRFVGTFYVALPIRNCVSKLPKFTKKQIEYKNVSENTVREISSEAITLFINLNDTRYLQKGG